MQVEIYKGCKKQTTFSIRTDNYQIEVMPFGLKKALSIFQRMMDEALKNKSFMQAYLDDIAVFSGMNERITYLKNVFPVITGPWLKLKMYKYHFYKKNVEPLGHRVRSDGVAVDQKRDSNVFKTENEHGISLIVGFMQCIYKADLLFMHHISSYNK